MTNLTLAGQNAAYIIELQEEKQKLVKALKDIQAVQENPYYSRYNEWLECVQDMNQIARDVLKEIKND